MCARAKVIIIFLNLSSHKFSVIVLLMKISIFFGTALGTRIFEHLYLSAGPLCGWPGYIDGYFCLCVYMHKPRRASLSDGYCLFVADRCSLLTRLKAQ